MSDDRAVATTDRERLAKQYAAPAPTTNARIPEIRLSVAMSKKDVPKGHFFIVDRNVEQGEEAIITDIGTSFECIVLRDAKNMFAFDSEDNKPLAESTEFRDFMNDVVFVIDNAGDRPCIATVAPYTIIKDMRYEPNKEELKRYKDTGGKEGRTHHPLYPVLKDLKLQYLVYVLYKPEGGEYGLYLLKPGARGWLGMEKNGDACKYGEEESSSFVKCASQCHKETPRATHMHTWKVFAKTFKSREGTDDHYPAFEIKGQWKDDMFSTVEQSQAMLRDWLMQRYTSRIGFAWRNTSDREFVPQRVCEMLDASLGDADAAAITLGEKKEQRKGLTIGSAPALAAGTSTPRDRRTSAQQVADTAKEWGGDEPAPAPVESKSVQRRKAVQKAEPESQRTIEEAQEAAKKNVGAMESEEERRAKDPGLDKFLKDTEVEPSADKPVDASPSDIPPGW